jgi:hypothetical protein
MNWIDKITSWFRGSFRQPSKNDQSEQMIQDLMHMLKHTRREEASCEDVYEILDQYIELIARGEDAAQLMPLIKHHLDMCPECHEEYDALLRILEASPS